MADIEKSQQDHRSFPHITTIILHLVATSICFNNQHTLPDFLRHMDSYLGADGVYHEDLSNLEAWIVSLTPNQWLMAACANGNDLAKTTFENAPVIGPDRVSAYDFIYDGYLYCYK